MNEQSPLRKETKDPQILTKIIQGQHLQLRKRGRSSDNIGQGTCALKTQRCVAHIESLHKYALHRSKLDAALENQTRGCFQAFAQQPGGGGCRVGGGGGRKAIAYKHWGNGERAAGSQAGRTERGGASECISNGGLQDRPSQCAGWYFGVYALVLVFRRKLPTWFVTYLWEVRVGPLSLCRPVLLLPLDVPPTPAPAMLVCLQIFLIWPSWSLFCLLVGFAIEAE